MATQARLNDGSALLDLSHAIVTFREDGHAVTVETEATIRETQSKLEEKWRDWQAERDRRWDEYSACLRFRGEDGYGRDCSYEAEALRQAEEELATVERWMQIVQQAVEEYARAASRWTTFLNGDAIRATSFLGKKLRIVEEYNAIGATLTQMHAASPADHGYAYQQAKQQMLRQALNDPNLGRDVRGWIKQELNRLDRVQAAQATGLRPPGGNQHNLRMPPGFNAGHRQLGINRPSNLVLQNAAINKARPGIARGLGLFDIFR